jgi:hypothetical protein
MPSAFNRPSTSTMIQLLAALALPQAAAVASKYRVSAGDCVSTPASYAGRHVPIVLRLLLPAHRDGAPARAVPQPRLLLDRLPVREKRDLAVDLELERALDVPERVDVLGLGFHPERRIDRRAQRDIRVTPEAPLLHVAVVHTDGDEHLPDAAETGRRQLRRIDVGCGDDLDERHAAAIEVDSRVRPVLVQRLPRVLLHVEPRDADRAGAVGTLDDNMAIRGERLRML